MIETDFPFICADTEDNSPELSARIEAGDETASMFDKQVTQVAAITAQGAHFYARGKGCEKKFMVWLSRQPHKFVYFLNMQYDLGNLFSKTLDGLDCTLVGGRMIKALLGNKQFVDVFNIWFQSTKSLGEVFDLKKGEMDVNSRAYVFRDVEIIRAAMLYVWKFASELGLPEVPPTMGSLGVKLWRHWGGESVHESSELSRDAIFGGRVELFKNSSNITTTPQVAYTDVSSLYPSVMCGRFPGYLENTGKRMLDLGLVQATVSVPRCDITVLPYRNEDGKIFYPWGKFTGVWTLAELRQAEKDGAKIQKIHDVYSTNEVLYPYKTYIERIYQIRQASKSKAESELYKRLMNTLFGRTGSSGKIGRTINRTVENENSGIPYGTKVLVNYAMPLGDEVNWSHTAHITSYGRLRLLEHLKIIGAENMIYCDTDSTIFDCPSGIIPFETGSVLGQMKIEYRCTACNLPWHPKTPCVGGIKSDRYDLAIPYAPKQYRLGNEWKAKGVPKREQQKFIEQGSAAYEMPYKFREAINFYDRGNSKQLSVWRKIVKNNNANYDKKKLVGNRYFPCRVNDV